MPNPCAGRCPIVRTLRAKIEDARVLYPKSRLLVAVSGGQDSSALLHALAGVRSDYDITLEAAHLNHGLRGAEAGEDAGWVAAFAGALGVQLHVGEADVRGRAARMHRGFKNLRGWPAGNSCTRSPTSEA